MKTLNCTKVKKSGELCGGTMKQTLWRPPSNLDPLMRQYKCNKCRAITYLVDDNNYQRKFGLRQGIIPTGSEE